MGSSRSPLAEQVTGPGATPPVRRGSWRGQGPVVCVVAVGGAAGAAARYGMALLWPTPAGAFPWTTFVVNAVGCALIGVFLVLITEVWAAHRLVRPFFGTGVLGGFTTFSTYAVDIERLVDGGHPVTGAVCLAATPLAALAAVWAAVAATRRTVGVFGARGADGGNGR
ncbi:CrcB family protein [Streptomyces sp. ME19-01-6]|uniref:fluoride efflux transporter FluC n=1 Tax=Streptomyces sp. ME19-01-6 TaxID=3028686 RepID=UPI0029B11019|nr:CrcB family protein [Streptomyces sp. ME19-01-6]MDX3224149.1 CrcB family protein [Streptomyces sp. ME19-01-6]